MLQLKDDAAKQVKKLQQQLKEALREAEEARAGKEEAAGAAREAERRGKALEAEAVQHQEELAAADRARRQAEAERDDLLDELNNSASKVPLFINRLQLNLTNRCNEYK